MGEAAIGMEQVSKRYRLGAASFLTLQEALSSAVRRAGSSLGPREHIWALRDLSFGVDVGETLGVIGHNGAGKTTLLKILARITQPTLGVSRTRGRVGALLDVGTGFHPELTGRENIFLNGAILGMKRREIKRRFDEIVDFAGLERFLDTPLKRYSWGMSLRLAFSVAAHVEPEIVIVDEVLAVGDVRFREKCLGKLTTFGREGRTVVFVSHDLGSINQVCRRAIWLDKGTIRRDGRSEAVLDEYLRLSVAETPRAEFSDDSTKHVQLRSVAVTNEDGEQLDAPRRHEPFAIQARFLVRERVPGLDIGLSLRNRQGVKVINQDWGVDTGRGLVSTTLPAEYEAVLTIPPVLPAGEYMLGVWIGTRFDTFIHEHALTFRLWPHPDDNAAELDRDRAVQPAVAWEMRAAGLESQGRASAPRSGHG
jgi:ABC-type polysaccharide/polyol phosphate transport system ATPase subunit